jgi:diacylglycerol kinase family enzyme
MTMPPADTHRVLVLLNSRSGTGSDGARAQQVGQQFEAAGMQAKVILAHDMQEMRHAIDAARTEGIGVIVAGGGDGTQSSIAACLVGTELVQGVLPLGTLNHFARDLGIPTQLEDAIRTIRQGHVRRIDVGEVNGQVFVNNSSIGLYPEIVRERELQQVHLGKGKWRALASAIVHHTRTPHRLAVRITSAREEELLRTPFVFIGNNRYLMEGMRLGARERLDAGELALYTVRRRGRWALLVLALRALMHRLEQAADFEVLTGEGFVVSTRDARIRVATDGEVSMMDTPLHYTVRRQSLQVLVPPPA